MNIKGGGRSRPGLPTWFSRGAMFSPAIGAALAAVFSLLAAAGGLEMVVPFTDRAIYFSPQTCAGLAVLVSVPLICAGVQFILRAKRAQQPAVSLAREGLIYLVVAVAVAIGVVLAWPATIVALHIGGSKPEQRQINYGFAVRGMASTVDFPVHHRPWLTDISEEQRQTLGWSTTVGTCDTDAYWAWGMFEWTRFAPGERAQDRGLDDVDDIRKYCKEGVDLSSIAASNAARQLLSRFIKDGDIDFEQAEIDAAEGRPSTPGRMGPQARYILFRANPQAAARLGAESLLEERIDELPPTYSFHAGPYRPIDHRLAIYECDAAYSAFLLAAGVQPDDREVLALLKSMGTPQASSGTGPGSGEPGRRSLSFYGPLLPDGNRFPPLQVRDDDIAGCTDLLDVYLRELDIADGFGRELDLRRIVESIAPNSSEPVTALHRKVMKALLLNTGVAGVAEVLAEVVARDEELGAWATSLPPSEVRRKIPASEYLDRYRCRDGEGCRMTRAEAKRLLGAFLR